MTVTFSSWTIRQAQVAKETTAIRNMKSDYRMDCCCVYEPFVRKAC